jgi:hypothetical protein
MPVIGILLIYSKQKDGKGGVRIGVLDCGVPIFFYLG